MDNNIDDFRIDEALGFAINRASIILRKKLTQLLKNEGYDITPEEFVIMSRLWEVDGLLQSVINDKTLKDKTTVTRLLERLIKKGLVEKRTHEEDRRNYRIHLTVRGNELKRKIIPIVVKLNSDAAVGINIEDLKTTIKTLRIIFENVNGDEL